MENKLNHHRSEIHSRKQQNESTFRGKTLFARQTFEDELKHSANGLNLGIGQMPAGYAGSQQVARAKLIKWLELLKSQYTKR